MAFQFIHISTYARKAPKKTAKGKDRKWTVRDVAGEAERVPQNSHHVPSPQPPTLVFGMSVRQAVDEAEKRAEASSDVSGRKVRADTPVMLAGVASHQFTVDELQEPDKLAEYDEWKRLNLEFLQKKYGKNLLSVIEHTDEKHPHLHFYVVPDAGKGFNAKKLHDGYLAGDAARDPPEQKRLYNDAMRKLQDAYHAEVGVKCGQARLGPKRRRMSRGEWLQEQQQLVKAKEAWMGLKERVNETLKVARRQARKIVSEATAKAQEKGLRFGAFFDGLRGNAKALLERIERERDQERAKRKKAEAEKEKTAQELVHERLRSDETIARIADAKTQPLRSELSREKQKRQELEKQLDSLSSENQTLKQQLKPKRPGPALPGRR